MNLDYLLFTERDILERVDEYTLYCFYLRYEPLIGGKYPAPYRKDEDPSWGIFEITKRLSYGDQAHEFLWKDNARGEVGNIFTLVMKLFGYSDVHQAKCKICADFGLGGTNTDQMVIQPVEKKYADPISIEIASRPFDRRDLTYWKQFNITQEILKEYTVSAIKCYWIAEDQKVPSYPSGPGYAYREWDKYQLYFPFAPKEKKFRTNFSKDICVHGFKQLRRNSDLCIITKSRKDVMCLRSFGYEAIAPMSENTLVPEACLKALEKIYPRRLILFDNDGKHRAEDYAEPAIYIPLSSGQKDVSDYCKTFGPDDTAEMLKQIIN